MALAICMRYMCTHARYCYWWAGPLFMYTTRGRLPLGLDKLCQHNFENNRYSQEYKNNAGIIGKAFCVIITFGELVIQTTRTLVRRLCFTLYHASVQQKALIFQTTRTLIRRLCFTLYHSSVQQKALIFVSQNMIVFIVYNVE